LLPQVHEIVNDHTCELAARDESLGQLSILFRK
jgi:hypothetical protein